jgi:hypothetical protein
MLSIVLWSSIIVGGSIAYGVLGGYEKSTSAKKENTTKSSDNKKDIYNETYNYIKSLSYDEQERYIHENYKLSQYENHIKRNISLNDKHQTARFIADIAVREGRSFNNINSSK